MNVDMTGALYTLSLLILDFQCKEGASDLNLHRTTAIISSSLKLRLST